MTTPQDQTAQRETPDAPAANPLWITSVAVGTAPFLALLLALPYLSGRAEAGGVSGGTEIITILAVIAGAFLIRRRLLLAHEMRRAGALVARRLPASTRVRALTYGTAGAALVAAALYAATQTLATGSGLTRSVLACGALSALAITPSALRYMRRIIGTPWRSSHMAVTLIGLPALALGLGLAYLATPSAGAENPWMLEALGLAIFVGISAYVFVSTIAHGAESDEAEGAEGGEWVPLSRRLAIRFVGLFHEDLPLQERTEKVASAERVFKVAGDVLPLVLFALPFIIF